MFNTEKLDWFNQQHIARLAPDEFARRLKPFFEAAGIWDDAYLGERHAWFFAVLELLKPRAKRLDDFADARPVLLHGHGRVRRGGRRKHLRVDGMRDISPRSTRRWRSCRFDPASTEAALRASAEARGVKAAALIHAVRVAVTGKTVSPGLFEVAGAPRSRADRARLAPRGEIRAPRLRSGNLPSRFPLEALAPSPLARPRLEKVFPLQLLLSLFVGKTFS